MSPAKKKKLTVKTKSESASDAVHEQQRILDSLAQDFDAVPELPLEQGLKPVLDLRYYRQYYPSNPEAPLRLRESLQVSAAEVAKYLAYCLQETVKVEEVTEGQRLQFVARKHEFWFDATIPEPEKSVTFDLIAWHKLGLRYAPDDSQAMRQMLYEKLARQAWAEMAYVIEFLQALGFNQAPRPVPEAMLKALEATLDKQIAKQQELLDRLQRFEVPIWVQAGTSKQLLRPAEICLISSEPNQGLAVYTLSGQRHVSFERLADLEPQLCQQARFMRTSRQHLVNLEQIRTVTPEGRGRTLSFYPLDESILARVTATYLSDFLARLGQLSD